MSTVASQFSKIALRIGEPENEDDRRFTPAQYLLALNPARRWVAERSQSLQIKDSQTTAIGTKLYNLPLDVCEMYVVEWDGVPLDFIPINLWRANIGTNDELRGRPVVCTYFARQLQLFPVPDRAATLRYHGYGYPSPLAVGGSDSEYMPEQEEASCWKAAADLKAADERDFAYELKQAEDIVLRLAAQYEPPGARFAKQQASVNPFWAMMQGGS